MDDYRFIQYLHSKICTLTFASNVWSMGISRGSPKKTRRGIHRQWRNGWVSRDRRICSLKRTTRENDGSGGIWTHASWETGALNQRLGPLGHATTRPVTVRIWCYRRQNVITRKESFIGFGELFTFNTWYIQISSCIPLYSVLLLCMYRSLRRLAQRKHNTLNLLAYSVDSVPSLGLEPYSNLVVVGMCCPVGWLLVFLKIIASCCTNFVFLRRTGPRHWSKSAWIIFLLYRFMYCCSYICRYVLLKKTKVLFVDADAFSCIESEWQTHKDR